MSDWKPIETAPRDGSDILVCVTHNTPDPGVWETIMWVDYWCKHYRWVMFGQRIDIPFSPTHWMPLPAPPALAHASDCATHNMPAMPAGECDCKE